MVKRVECRDDIPEKSITKFVRKAAEIYVDTNKIHHSRIAKIANEELRAGIEIDDRLTKPVVDYGGKILRQVNIVLVIGGTDTCHIEGDFDEQRQKTVELLSSFRDIDRVDPISLS